MEICAAGLQRRKKLAYSWYYRLRSTPVYLNRFWDVFISRWRHTLVKITHIVSQLLILSVSNSQDFGFLSVAKIHIRNLFALGALTRIKLWEFFRRGCCTLIDIKKLRTLLRNIGGLRKLSDYFIAVNECDCWISLFRELILRASRLGLLLIWLGLLPESLCTVGLETI